MDQNHPHGRGLSPAALREADGETWLSGLTVIDVSPVPLLSREDVKHSILELLLHWHGQDSVAVRRACKHEINRLAHQLHERGFSLRETYDRIEDRLPRHDRTMLSYLMDKAFDGVGGWWA